MNPEYCLPDLWVMHSLLRKRQQEARREARDGGETERGAAAARDFWFERNSALGPLAVPRGANV